MVAPPLTTTVGRGLTVTVKLHVVELSEASFTVQITVVWPCGNEYPARVLPPLRLLVTEATEQLSPVEPGSNSDPTAS